MVTKRSLLTGGAKDHNMKTHKILHFLGLLVMPPGVLHVCPCYISGIFTEIKLPGSEEKTHQSTTTTTSSDAWNCLNVVGSNVRINMLVDHFKKVVDCFFAVWLSIVFVAISCIGSAMPFILCGMICCYFLCIVSILGIHVDMNQIRGASKDSINSFILQHSLNQTFHRTPDMQLRSCINPCKIQLE
ncbi:unnamed protein product [Lactuca saligna]|uniref:Uncharacterized protein n=1 Tax=Lactuca saligna TaxID=75948 RepID=A0AA35V2N3_LACSI|nr:unnamed protein product [Lactuca saligna]